MLLDPIDGKSNWKFRPGVDKITYSWPIKDETALRCQDVLL